MNSSLNRNTVLVLLGVALADSRVGDDPDDPSYSSLLLYGMPACMMTTRTPAAID